MKHISFICLMICLVVLILPVTAADYTTTSIPEFIGGQSIFFDGVTSFSYDASTKDNRISRIYFDAPMDATITFTLYYGNNSVVNGEIESHRIGILNERVSTTLTLGGVVSTYNYINVNPSYEVDIAGYARNNTDSQSGFLLYSYAYGTMDNNNAAFYPVNSISQNTIYRIDASCTRTFSAEVVEASVQSVSESVGKSAVDTVFDWVNFAIQISFTIFGFATSTFYWLKFFLWDNLVLTIALYIGITGAVAFNQSKDIFAAIKKFFQYQRGLYDFVLKMWQILIELVAAFRGIFRI